MLCVGMSPCSIRSGAMSLVFNDYVDEKEQRKVCDEYDLTMNEDLQSKFEEWKIRDAEVERLMNSHKGPMGTVEDNANHDPRISLRQIADRARNVLEQEKND